MRSNFLIGVICAVFLSLIGVRAEAALVEFSFSSTVNHLAWRTTNIPGTFDGQSVEISIFADNGGSSIYNQTWGFRDFVSATVNVGNGVYVANFTYHSANHPTFVIETDASGFFNEFYLETYPKYNTDTLGSDNITLRSTSYMVVNTERYQTTDQPYQIFRLYTQEEPLDHYWTPSLVSTIPLPATLPLYGAGLAVLAFLGWQRKRKIRVA